MGGIILGTPPNRYDYLHAINKEVPFLEGMLQKGDSGGPLLGKRDDKYYIIAIAELVTGGPNPCESRLPSFNQQWEPVYPYLGWIQKQMLERLEAEEFKKYQPDLANLEIKEENDDRNVMITVDDWKKEFQNASFSGLNHALIKGLLSKDIEVDWFKDEKTKSLVKETLNRLINYSKQAEEENDKNALDSFSSVFEGVRDNEEISKDEYFKAEIEYIKEFLKKN